MTLRSKRMRVLRWFPDSLVWTRGPADGKSIYLTFDDGPDPRYTPGLLDLLSAHQVRASFFLIGRLAEQHPRLVERIVAEGHRLGNHSYSHPMFNELSLAEQLAEIERTDRVLASFDGLERHGFRPPRGMFSLALTWHFARDRRQLVYWSYDSLDYQRRPPEELARLLQDHPPVPGDAVLMHDDSDCSTHMLEKLLPEWRSRGLEFSALPA